MIFLTADTHFNHENIIRYCKRPFSSKEEMNEILKERWNSIVTDNDTVFHLGDVMVTNCLSMPEFMNQLNGMKIVIKGNHDRKSSLRKSFSDVHSPSYSLEHDGKTIALSHEPTEYTKPYDYKFCGHIHEKWMFDMGSLNVGVDVWNFHPISLEFARSCFDLLKSIKSWPYTMTEMEIRLYGKTSMGTESYYLCCIKESLEKFSDGSGVFKDCEVRVLRNLQEREQAEKSKVQMRLLRERKQSQRGERRSHQSSD